jgi:hypothetical protein
MKLIFFFVLIGVVETIGCRGIEKDPIPDFIPGTYIRFSSHEFGKEYDTLVIKKEFNNYAIERKWRYERNLDGKSQGTEYKKVISIGIYTQGSIKELRTGIILTLDPKNGFLYCGQTKFTKITQTLK